jgi:hypothetical protein
MNIFDETNDPAWLKLLILAGVLVPSVLLVIYAVTKSKALSDFLEALSDERLGWRDKFGVLFRVLRRSRDKIG